MSWEQPELLAVFPFPHTLELDVSVHGASLTIETTLRASSQVAVPVSFGYHPYLTLPSAERSSWQIELPVRSALQLDARMIPTGVREPVHYPPFALGRGSWDNAFSELERPPLFALSAAGRRIELELLEGYPYAQVYAPRGERFVCFEPMTAPTNALVSREDLPSVAPGGAFRAAFRISVG
jgi:aldose 1-epimerase